MALSLFRAPILPLALMGGVAALVWSQRKKGPVLLPEGVPKEGFPEPGGTAPGGTAPGGTPSAAFVYCNNAAGCTLTEQDGSLVGTAPYATQFIVTDRMEGWVRVRGDSRAPLADQAQGWVREIALTNIDPILVAPIPQPPPPPPPPPVTAPGGSPLTPPPELGLGRREPVPGDPCIGHCPIYPPNTLDRVEPRTHRRDLLEQRIAIVPFGGQVDVIGPPLFIRETEGPGEGGFLGIGEKRTATFTPIVNPTGDFQTYYYIRYCYPGGCAEGWMNRTSLVSAV